MAPSLKADAIEKLKEDWVSEALNDRPEDVTKWQLQTAVMAAKEKVKVNEEDPGPLLELAEAYALLHPTDKRCWNVCDRLMTLGVQTLDLQTQGRAYQLHGRCLFLAQRFEESLGALARARACFRDMGTRALRRQNNAGLLRAYAALGRSREAAERLEVAFTLCEKEDDCIQLYMDAKSALEHTGIHRDAEVLDDIWYVWLDTHSDVKAKFESYQDTCNSMTGQLLAGADEDQELTWSSVKEAVREVLTDKKLKPIFQVALAFLVFNVALLVLLHVVKLLKH
mmetsp:Transcript_568/g.1089  ORF Transcript_568/g.1089 Transcript_568/m.1089 type:complete len:282 (-) Transcript_568:80-925(-)